MLILPPLLDMLPDMVMEDPVELLMGRESWEEANLDRQTDKQMDKQTIIKVLLHCVYGLKILCHFPCFLEK